MKKKRENSGKLEIKREGYQYLRSNNFLHTGAWAGEQVLKFPTLPQNNKTMQVQQNQIL